MKNVAISIQSIEFYSNSNNFAITPSQNYPATKADGTKLDKAVIFVTAGQLRSLANKAGVLSKNLELIISKLEGATIQGCIHHEVGDEYEDQDGNIQAYTSQGLRLGEIKTWKVVRSAASKIAAMAALETAEMNSNMEAAAAAEMSGEFDFGDDDSEEEEEEIPQKKSKSKKSAKL